MLQVGKFRGRVCFKREELAINKAGSFSFLGERVNLINGNGEINCNKINLKNLDGKRGKR